MKILVDLFFMFGSASVKPSCRVIDKKSGELLASVTRDSWEEAEKAAIREAEKHIATGGPPAARTIEIEVPDEIIELTEDMQIGSRHGA